MTMTESTINRAGVIKLWLLNFVANAAVVAVWYFWLTIPDARGWQLAATALIGVTTIALILWLRAGTLTWFRVAGFRKDAGIWRAYRHSIRYVPALGFWVATFVVVAWMLWGMRDYVPQFAVWASQKLNGGPPPRNIMNNLNWLLIAIVGYVLPALWIPIATTVAASGVHPEHLARSRRVWKHGRYWLWLLMLLSAGLYVPYRIVWWVPEVQTIQQQTWSMGMRFLLAYLIVVTAFIAIIWIAGVYADREDPL